MVRPSINNDVSGYHPYRVSIGREHIMTNGFLSDEGKAWLDENGAGKDWYVIDGPYIARHHSQKCAWFKDQSLATLFRLFFG